VILRALAIQILQILSDSFDFSETLFLGIIEDYRDSLRTFIAFWNVLKPRIQTPTLRKDF